MPQVIGAAGILAGLGSAGVAVTGATAAFIQAGVYAVAYAGITVGVSIGLSSIARAQLPDPEVGKISRREARPQRVFAMGLPSRIGPA